ncbi:asparagine synthase (glutamine-hydrolyzing) [Nitratireductor sp. GISD-1A_MAKvit]|uniref:asparagine synthase (glutamine-hydrolyzing) n=1 Tax=Nitratireductor sp. GISD-1A_MAKvit TaxID=3234198 RepID=UPI003467E88B
MCGIAGYSGKGLAPREAETLLMAMSDAIAHRGPDETGLQIRGDTGLAHRRLSIVDLEDGQQPMEGAGGRLRITYNGEIFNHIELRRDLECRGHRFRTASDTEVILRLYDEFGPDCVDRLNGDFAFAIHDARLRRLFLARDRMGVRPLYHTWHGGRFYFASEIKALLAVPGIEPRLDPFALDQIFTLWSPIPPRTAFTDVQELPPGHRMIVQNGAAKVERYWDLDFSNVTHDRSEAERAEEVRAMLEDATRLRLRADVEVGTYLSGGLDSSVITNLARQRAPNGLSSFAVTFKDPALDESRYQEEMARVLGTRHHSIECDAEAIATVFPEVVRHAEQPVLRTAPAPLYLLSKLVRSQGIKAVLSGEGADEIFAGYDIFKEARLRRFCARQPSSQLRPHLFRKIYPYLANLKRQTPDYLAAFFAISADQPNDPLFSHRPRFRNTAGAKLFFSGALKETLKGYNAADELVSILPDAFGSWHPLHQAQYLETRFLLPGYILSSQGDRMAMAHGIETRFPFLDHRIVTLASQIPANVKLRGLREKHLLREATADLVPKRIADRPKQPYRAPDAAAFAGCPPAYVEEAFQKSGLKQNCLFDVEKTVRLYNKSRLNSFTGFRDNAAFVGILSTQLWTQQFARQVRTADATLTVHT